MTFIRVYIQNREINSQLRNSTNLLIDRDSYNRLLKYREKEMYFNNGSVISQDLLLVDEHNNSIPIFDLIANNDSSSKMIIRYSALACDACLYEELKVLEDFFNRIGIENVIILASNHNVRSLKVRKSTLSVDLAIFQIEETGIPFEEKNSSLFVFLLDKDFIVKDFFIPEKTLPELSKNYYSIICEKYYK